MGSWEQIFLYLVLDGRVQIDIATQIQKLHLHAVLQMHDTRQLCVLEVDDQNAMKVRTHCAEVWRHPLVR